MNIQQVPERVFSLGKLKIKPRDADGENEEIFLLNIQQVPGTASAHPHPYVLYHAMGISYHIISVQIENGMFF